MVPDGKPVLANWPLSKTFEQVTVTVIPGFAVGVAVGVGAGGVGAGVAVGVDATVGVGVDGRAVGVAVDPQAARLKAAIAVPMTVVSFMAV